MTSTATTTPRTIAGYTLLERIGAGGYGEVWKAEAPGGLTKAVKLVYGYLGDERADCEQKALQRIKDAHHPFLLSLERIEVIDGQLVIVTELAEASFKDRFEECRQEDMPGIPREELLSYLRDIADALDYICKNFSLQHLDVKPENLLLLSGRAKVGDFGLVKQIQDKTLSLMGGLTPVYASPEIFDGRPTLYSDQYSLAIVYQEMLTSALPFPGRTPAQLAVQHASAEPRLGPLPAIERATIARALAKNPEERFPNCRAMVDSLAAISQSGINRKQSSAPADAPTKAPARADSVTTPVDFNSIKPKPKPHTAATMATVALERGTTDPPQRPQPNTWSVAQALGPAPQVEDLPPIEVLADQQRLQPTLLLGIGGTGARVLRQLRGRLNDRYGDVDIPSIKMMMLDTDPSAIADAMAGNSLTALSPQETLALPLRRTQQYRSNAQKYLAWLSRRWLYNIPRSLKTKGLRPLGRLALVDHAPAVLERLRKNLAAVTAPDALAASAEAVGIAPGDRTPRVYIVASVSGGTGSGMVLDVAAMARKILVELDLSDERLLGMLTHSTSGRPDEHDMAVANAYACLGELHHYHRTRSYPGDIACQLSASDEDTPIFKHTYLVPLGERLDEQQFDTATDSIAQYLYLDAFTPAGIFFDSHRAAEENTSGDPADSVHLRTFGLSQIGCSSGDLPAVASDVVCRQVVAGWQGDSSAADAESEQAAGQLAEKLQINLHAYVAQALKVVSNELGAVPETPLSAQVTEHNDSASSAWVLLNHASVELVSKHCADPENDSVPDTLEAALKRSLDETAANQGTAVAEWILQWANDSSAGVASARRGNTWFSKHLHELEFDLQQLLTAVEVQIDQAPPLAAKAGKTIPAGQKSSRGWMPFKRQPASGEQHLLHYRSMRLARMVLGQVGETLRAIRQHTVVAGDRLGDLSHALNQLADQFPQDGRLDQLATETDTQTPQAEDPQQPVARAMHSQISSLAAEVDRQLRDGLLAEDGLWGILGQHDSLQDLTDGLRTNSRATVLQALKQLGVARMMLDSDGDQHGVTDYINSIIKNAQPALLGCGGARRVLVVTPDGKSAGFPTDNENHVNPQPSVVTDSDSDLTICHEMAGLSARRAAVMLIDCRPDYEQVASRLHTRIDVDWSNFDLS